MGGGGGCEKAKKGIGHRVPTQLTRMTLTGVGKKIGELKGVAKGKIYKTKGLRKKKRQNQRRERGSKKRKRSSKKKNTPGFRREPLSCRVPLCFRSSLSSQTESSRKELFLPSPHAVFLPTVNMKPIAIKDRGPW